MRIGSRDSPLAVAQAVIASKHIASVVKEKIEFQFVHTLTTGDILQKPFNQINQDNLFIKEVEEMLRNHTVDVAIHSMKDIPVLEHSELEIVAAFPAASYHDCLISEGGHKTIMDLPANCKIGTSSARRTAQILKLRRDVEIVPLRGNVTTRLQKMSSGNFGAIILANAGLERLGINSGVPIGIDEMLPCAGQGVIVAQVRKDDQKTKERVALANHIDTWIRVQTERYFLRLINAGCGDPVACLASLRQNSIELRCMILSRDGSLHYEACKQSYEPTVAAEWCAKKLEEYTGIWKQS